MDWALRGLQAVAPFTPYLLPPRCPDCHCLADCTVPSDIVGLLGRQLDRCGPEQLTCPSCPVQRCPEPAPALGAFAAGAAVGALAVIVAALALQLRRPGAAPAPAIDDGEPLLALAEGDEGRPAAAATPASLRASRG